MIQRKEAIIESILKDEKNIDKLKTPRTMQRKARVSKISSLSGSMTARKMMNENKENSGNMQHVTFG